MKAVHAVSGISAVAILLALSASPALARRHHSGPVDRIQAATQKLDLTAEQQTKVNTILTDLRQNVHKLAQHAAGTKLTKDHRHEIEKALHKAEKDIDAVLTSKQRKEFKTALHEHHREMHKHHSTTQPAA